MEDVPLPDVEVPLPEPESDEVPVPLVEPDEPLELVEPPEPVLVPLPVPEPLLVLFVVGGVPLEPLVPVPVDPLDDCDVLVDELPVPVGSDPVEPVSAPPVVGVVPWLVAALEALLSSVALTDAPGSVIAPEGVLDERLEELAGGVECCADSVAECCLTLLALEVCDANFAWVCATSETLTAAAASWTVAAAGDEIGPA